MKHYKPTRYKAHKKPINKLPFVILGAAVLMLGLSVALGAYLNTLSAPSTDADTDTQASLSDPYSVYDGYSKLSVQKNKYMALDGYAYSSDDDAETAILRANGSLVRALCIDLLDASGAPSYNSSFYKNTYSAECGKIDLSLLLSRLTKNGIEFSAYFELCSQMTDFEGNADARTDLELGIIKEAYAAGLRDITVSTGEKTEADILYAYIKRIKEACPELAVGICMDADLLYSDSIYTAKLDDIFDYLAIDLTAKLPASSDDGGTTQAFFEASGAYLVIAQRFESRMLVRSGDGCELCKSTAKEAFEALGVDSFMLVCGVCGHDK